MKNFARVSELRPSWAHTITPGVVIDHHRQVAVPLAVGDFVDPDAPQPFQLIDLAGASVTTCVTTAATVRQDSRSNTVSTLSAVCAAPPTLRSRAAQAEPWICVSVRGGAQ